MATADAPQPISSSSSSRRRSSAATHNPRRSSQHSAVAKNVLMSNTTLTGNHHPHSPALAGDAPRPVPAQPSIPQHASPVGLPRSTPASAKDSAGPSPTELKPAPAGTHHHHGHGLAALKDGVGAALSDTPMPSMPGSPNMSGSTESTATTEADKTRMPARTTSANSTPRIRPTTLDIPGLTKSKVSPDGKIAQRDIGSKLVIVMVGLPARGKSYITKKMTRYLNWLQHDAKIFNVGEKRRVAASGSGFRLSQASLQKVPSDIKEALKNEQTLPQIAAKLLINGETANSQNLDTLNLPSPAHADSPQNETAVEEDDSIPRVRVTSPGPEAPTPPKAGDNPHDDESMEQSASFFDPSNKRAAQIREQCAMETLDDLLDYILKDNGAVGIFDATNSTLARRKQIMERIRARAGPELNVLFVESLCKDKTLLESNMRLKLSGPDYRDKDPVAALEDFKKRVAIYEKNYIELGDYEEDNHMPYVKMIDVGRKMVSHQVRGFIASQAVYYLMNFNLSPRMIWITRHGESMDNVAGKIGGDSDLSDNGRKYAKAMTRFIEEQKKAWAVALADKIANTHFPPAPGDHTPPNPHFGPEAAGSMNFCVWTSMLKRSVQSAQYFCDEEYDIKQMRMLDELNAGIMEGMTYDEIRTKHQEDFLRRRQDKLAYRYPGPGGEGYLDVINRIRPVIVELERMTDHCLLVTHRSVARVLLAYFRGLKREDVADLDCPLGMLYQLEPRPYGVEFKAWRYNSETDSFDHLPEYQLRRANSHH